MTATPETPLTPGQQLRSLMDDQGRTYAWLARETGYSESYIFKVIKTGKKLQSASGNQPWEFKVLVSKRAIAA